MIFTECPSCSYSQSFGWECGDPTGYFPSKCGACGKVMWVEATSCGGSTRSHDEFMRDVCKAGDEREVEVAAARAEDHNTLEEEDDDG